MKRNAFLLNDEFGRIDSEQNHNNHKIENIFLGNGSKKRKYSTESSFNQKACHSSKMSRDCRNNSKPYSFDKMKVNLENVLTETNNETALLILLSSEAHLRRYLLDLDTEKNKNEIEIILKLTTKFATENITLKSNFRSFLLLLIESEFIEKRLSKFVMNEITDEFNIDTMLTLLLFLEAFFIMIPVDAYKHLYHLTKLIVKSVSSCVDLHKQIDLLLQSVKFKYECDKAYDEKRFDKKYFRNPPDDFRNASIYPTTNDLSVKKERRTFLRSIKVQGAYESVDDYLDTLFRLTREDFVAPLREGVDFFKNPKNRKMPGMRLYEGVTIGNRILYRQSGVVYYLELDISRLRHVKWKESKRFLFGSLLCLSFDNFQTILLATVAERNAIKLSKGKLLVKFENSTVDTSKDYVLMETTNLFESYKHVLIRLQQSNSKNLAMAKYLVFAETETLRPKYLLDDPNRKYQLASTSSSETSSRSPSSGYNPFSCCDGDIGDIGRDGSLFESNNGMETNNDELIVMPGSEESIWPSCDLLQMDKSQYEALKSALTHELTIIQGPPGTGKTYVGLKICKILLENVSDKIRYFGPILIVCYTNHALDQFLEEISSFCKNIVRVGGRCKSKKLERFLLQNIKQKNIYSSNKNDCLDCIRNLNLDFIPLQAKINLSEQFLLNLHIIKPFMKERAYRYFKQNDMRNWIMGKSIWDSYAESQVETIIKTEIYTKVRKTVSEAYKEYKNNAYNAFDDSDMEYNYINGERMVEEEDKGEKLLKMQILDRMKELKQEICCEEYKEYSGAGIRNEKTTKKLFRKRIKINNIMTLDEANEIKNFSQLSINDRWRLYRFWRSKYVEVLNEEIIEIEKKFQNLKEQLDEICFAEEQRSMQKRKIIGMTTTGAARYGPMLQKLQCKIIIVEEAAEVLESHIIGSLNSGCEHLILIGDHKQLRPSTTVFDLARNYNLDLSLFERLVNNGLHYNTLTMQHRMRPEIAEVMRFIYNNLQNHESVLNYPNVLGVKENLFFFDHDKPETANSEMISYSNEFEAEMIIGLCQRFIDNGHDPSSITILTLYSGQMIMFRSLMGGQCKGVRVCNVDNFQGEENEIILLSFVRSNQEEKIGFLKTENRVCVSLSRAKVGLYAFGNFNLLAEKSFLWRNICQFLKEKNLLGNKMRLTCQNHQDKQIIVSNPRDFSKYPGGGCGERCQFVLECGHLCQLTCHIINREHADMKCYDNCKKKCVKGHPCQRKCWEQCGNCCTKELKTFPTCEHTKLMECFKIAQPSDCVEICKRQLSCGHQCMKKCNDPCSPCLVKVERKCSDCGNKNKQNCSDDHCTMPCIALLGCGHNCTGTCYLCNNSRLHVTCDKNCNIISICGHKNMSNCSNFDNFCSSPCQEGCHHRPCTKQCWIECDNCEEPCLWRCPHFQCSNKCYQFCNRPFCNKRCNKSISCNHCAKSFNCYGVCGEICRHVCIACDTSFIKQNIINFTNISYITLLTCGHTFEMNFLDKHMRSNDEGIQLKRCPTCNKIINNRSCFRYSNLVKIISLDIKRIQKLFTDFTRGNIFNKPPDDFLDRESQISRMIERLNVKTGQIKDQRLFDLQIRKWNIYLNLAISIKENLFSYCEENPDIFEKSHLFECIKKLLNWINPNRRVFDKFELEKFYQEFSRIRFLLELTKEKFSEFISSPDGSKFLDEIKSTKCFSNYGDLSTDLLKELNPEKGIEYYKGNWYKCKKGHYYLLEKYEQNSGCSKCKL